MVLQIIGYHGNTHSDNSWASDIPQMESNASLPNIKKFELQLRNSRGWRYNQFEFKF